MKTYHHLFDHLGNRLPQPAADDQFPLRLRDLIGIAAAIALVSVLIIIASKG